MISRNRDIFLYIFILTAGFVLRFADITLKPIHFDESINGYFVNQIWQKGFFTYSPDNFHGPLLFYLFQISEKIFGFGIHSFRYVTAFFSFATIWLILQSRFLFKGYGHLLTAMFIVVSPGMIFFGRSAIHESVFVFFQIVWIVGFLKTLNNQSQQDQSGPWWFFMGLLGSALLKETFVITTAAFLLAWGWVKLSPRVFILLNFSRKLSHPPQPASIDQWIALKILFISSGLWLVFYTGFFHHWQGTYDFFIALIPWLKTGVGESGHNKDFFYWTRLAMHYEWIVLFGLLGAGVGLFSRSWQMRFFSFFALFNGLVYSLIPYKTPWCFISILWPFTIIAGFWFDYLLDIFQKKRAFTLALFFITALVLGKSTISAYELNFKNPADPREPYIYVQTSFEYSVLENIIASKKNIDPAAQNMSIEVQLEDTWPFPWTFSRFPKLSYKDHKQPLGPGADVIIGESSASAAPLAGKYVSRELILRDARSPVVAFLKITTFKDVELPGFTEVPIPAEWWRPKFDVIPAPTAGEL